MPTAYNDRILEQISVQLEEIKNVLIQIRAQSLETNQILKGTQVDPGILTESNPKFLKLTEDNKGTHFVDG